MQRVAGVALLALAACGGVAPQDEASDDLIEGGAAHALPLDAAARTSAELRYYGGPVLENARVVAVLWGEDVDPAVQQKIGDFYTALLASADYSWLSEYDTDIAAVSGDPGTGQHIGKGSFAGAHVIKPHTRSTALTDAQIERELAAQIRAKKLPAPDADTLYMIHFPPGVSISMGGAGSCQSGGFCGYHNAFKRSRKRIAYAVLPDMSQGSGCDTGCGRGRDSFDLVSAVASHELVEAVTDPEVGLARNLAAPLAWYDEKAGEIGDICAGKTGRLRSGGQSFVVQKEWSNAAHACVLGHGRRADEDD